MILRLLAQDLDYVCSDSIAHGTVLALFFIEIEIRNPGLLLELCDTETLVAAGFAAATR